MQPGGKFVFMSSGAAILDREMGKYDQTYGLTKVIDIAARGERRLKSNRRPVQAFS